MTTPTPTDAELLALRAALQPVSLLDTVNGVHDENAARATMRALIDAVLELRTRLDGPVRDVWTDADRAADSGPAEEPGVPITTQEDSDQVDAILYGLIATPPPAQPWGASTASLPDDVRAAMRLVRDTPAGYLPQQDVRPPQHPRHADFGDDFGFGLAPGGGHVPPPLLPHEDDAL